METTNEEEGAVILFESFGHERAELASLPELTEELDDSTVIDPVASERLVSSVQRCTDQRERSHSCPDVEECFDGVENGESEWSSGKILQNEDKILRSTVSDWMSRETVERTEERP